MSGPPDLVERRLRYLERHRAALRRDGRAGPAAGSPQGTGTPNRHGLPGLPVGQRQVKNWPVLDLGHHPEIPPDRWRLEIGGAVDAPTTLDWDRFRQLPQVEDASDFHCVTTWSLLGSRWQGVRFSTIAELVVPRAEVRFVFCTGHDVAPGTSIPYTTNLPFHQAIQDDVLLVHSWNGQPLPREHGGPCRMITPRLYAWKGAKWIRRIEFLADDRPGFWEERGYSNTGDPWANDRYR